MATDLTGTDTVDGITIVMANEKPPDDGVDTAAATVVPPNSDSKSDDERDNIMKVGLRFRIDQLSNINSVDQQYDIVGVLDYDWVATEADKISFAQNKEQYCPEFIPRGEVRNCVEKNTTIKTWSTGGKYKIVNVDGIDYNTRRVEYDASFREPFEMQNYPFDVQDLTFVFGTRTANVCFVPSRAYPDQFFRIEMTYCGIPEWELVNLDVESQNIDWAQVLDSSHSAQDLKPRIRQRMLFRIQVARKSFPILMRIVFWMFLLGLLSIGMYGVNPEDIGDRLSYTITQVLAVVAFQFVIGESLPRVSYLTIIDRYNIFIFISIMICCVEALFVGWYSHEWDVDTVEEIDHLCFICYFIYYIVGNAIFAVYAYARRRWERGKIKKSRIEVEKLLSEKNQSAIPPSTVQIEQFSKEQYFQLQSQ